MDSLHFIIPNFLKPINNKSIPTQIRKVIDNDKSESVIDADLKKLIDVLKDRIKASIMTSTIKTCVPITWYPICIWMHFVIVDDKMWKENTISYQTLVRDLGNASLWYEKLIPDVLQGDKLNNVPRFRPCRNGQPVILEDDAKHLTVIGKSVQLVSDAKLTRLEVNIFSTNSLYEFAERFKPKIASLF